MTEETTHPDQDFVLEMFPYRSVPDRLCPPWDGLRIEDLGTVAGSSFDRGSLSASPRASLASLADVEQRLGEECARSFEAGRQAGYQEGRAAEQAVRDAAQEDLQASANAAAPSECRQLLEQASGLLENFAREQARCLEAWEPQVVRLALSVAGCVLRHEAQVDPLLLTGAVRVALGQIPASARIRLLVPLADLDLWTEAIALLPNLPVKPVVTAREGMQLGDCLLETDLGSADLGIASQLFEIERTLLDRTGDAQDLTLDGNHARHEPEAEP